MLDNFPKVDERFRQAFNNSKRKAWLRKVQFHRACVNNLFVPSYLTLKCSLTRLPTTTIPRTKVLYNHIILFLWWQQRRRMKTHLYLPLLFYSIGVICIKCLRLADNEILYILCVHTRVMNLYKMWKGNAKMNKRETKIDWNHVISFHSHLCIHFLRDKIKYRCANQQRIFLRETKDKKRNEKMGNKVKCWNTKSPNSHLIKLTRLILGNITNRGGYVCLFTVCHHQHPSNQWYT